MLVAQSQFARRAQHAERFHAAQFGFFDTQVARQHRANSGQRHFDADSDVGCTADDLQGVAVTAIHAGDAQFVRIGVRIQGQHLRNHHSGKFRRGAFHAVHFQPRHRQPFRQQFWRQRNAIGFFQPICTQQHGSSSKFMTELAQEAHVVLEKQAQIVHAVAQHR